MYGSQKVKDAILLALQRRGLAWPQPSARDAESVAARRMAFAAMLRYSTLRPSAIAEAVGTTQANAPGLLKSLDEWRDPQAVQAWIEDVGKVLEAGCDT
jgi:hypothetical protein